MRSDAGSCLHERRQGCAGRGGARAAQGLSKRHGAVTFISNIIDGQPSLHWLSSALPVHHWQRWTHLPQGGPAELVGGLAVRAT